MDLRSKKRRPVNDRVALFVWVPGRIGSTTGQLTGRQARANHFLTLDRRSLLTTGWACSSGSPKDRTLRLSS